MVSLRTALGPSSRPKAPAGLGRRRILATAGGLAVVVSGLMLGGCSGGGGGKQVLLVSYAVTKGAYDRILPKFEEDWKRRTGEEVKVKASYGGSGAQTRAVIDGLDADITTLALVGDALKLEKAGLVKPGWRRKLPHRSIITHSVVALIVREGNPKGIKDWPDLANPDVQVVSANPKTSGGARWNFLALWNSVVGAGGSEDKAKSYIAAVYRNVQTLPKDAREASDVFLKRGQGDVLLNYENEALLARRNGELKGPFLVPERNVLIEGPVTVVDRNVDRKGTRKVAEALARYLSGPEAQEIFAEEGFRPVDPQVWARVQANYAPVKQLARARDYGGWETIDKKFFSEGGLWDQIFRNSR